MRADILHDRHGFATARHSFITKRGLPTAVAAS